MTDDDVTRCLRLLAGYWPHPEMTDDELRVWTMTLAGFDARPSVDVIRSFATGDARENPREFRPTAGLFEARYRARIPRFSAREPEPAPALDVTTARLSPAEWRTRIRSQVARATGPLADDLKATTEAL